MKTLLSNWSVFRIIRAVLAVVIIIQAIIQKDLVFGILGGVFLFTALANVGCCGSAGCTIDTTKEAKGKTIVYEELDHKK